MKTTTTGFRRVTTTALALLLSVVTAAVAVEAAGAAEPAQSAPADGWRHEACPPPAEPGTGPSTIKVTGPCAFEHKGLAECEAPYDDFLVTAVRKTKKKGAELLLFINVERYVGPGTYKAPNDVLVSLKDGDKIYRWWTNSHAVTVGPGSKSVTLQDVRLEPELVLIGCTGPQLNFQCDGRGDEPGQMKTEPIISGTIFCKAPAVKAAVKKKK